MDNRARKIKGNKLINTSKRKRTDKYNIAKLIPVKDLAIRIVEIKIKAIFKFNPFKGETKHEDKIETAIND